jgi:hypothetical protein
MPKTCRMRTPQKVLCKARVSAQTEKSEFIADEYWKDQKRDFQKVQQKL